MDYLSQVNGIYSYLIVGFMSHHDVVEASGEWNTVHLAEKVHHWKSIPSNFQAFMGLMKTSTLMYCQAALIFLQYSDYK